MAIMREKLQLDLIDGRAALRFAPYAGDLVVAAESDMAAFRLLYDGIVSTQSNDVKACFRAIAEPTPAREVPYAFGRTNQSYEHGYTQSNEAFSTWRIGLTGETGAMVPVATKLTLRTEVPRQVADQAIVPSALELTLPDPDRNAPGLLTVTGLQRADFRLYRADDDNTPKGSVGVTYAGVKYWFDPLASERTDLAPLPSFDEMTTQVQQEARVAVGPEIWEMYKTEFLAACKAAESAPFTTGSITMGEKGRALIDAHGGATYWKVMDLVHALSNRHPVDESNLAQDFEKITEILASPEGELVAQLVVDHTSDPIQSGGLNHRLEWFALYHKTIAKAIHTSASVLFPALMVKQLQALQDQAQATSDLRNYVETRTAPMYRQNEEGDQWEFVEDRPPHSTVTRLWNVARSPSSGTDYDPDTE
jgi:hypothetical protein